MSQHSAYFRRSSRDGIIRGSNFARWLNVKFGAWTYAKPTLSVQTIYNKINFLSMKKNIKDEIFLHLSRKKLHFYYLYHINVSSHSVIIFIYFYLMYYLLIYLKYFITNNRIIIRLYNKSITNFLIFLFIRNIFAVNFFLS